MACVHLVKLYQLCQQEGIRIGGPDLIHLVCEQCGEKEVCPSVLMDEYDAQPGEGNQPIAAPENRPATSATQDSRHGK